jgi:Flp pilus assembly protein TadG
MASSPRRTRRGAILVYSLVGMTAFIGISSLAVDYGRVQLTKTELQRAADAAARYAATGLYDSTAASKASYIASQNTADGVAIALHMGGGDDDVIVGHWDSATNTFIAAGTPSDAVKVYARRTTARGNPVQLIFAALIGQRNCDVTVSAVATTSPTGYGVVGLNSITMNGNTTDSYWSSAGYTPGRYGSIASNGIISLSGNSLINGDANPGPGKMVMGSNHVTGSTVPLNAPLTFPNGSAGTFATTNDNAQIPSGNIVGGGLQIGNGSSLTLPGGNYYLSSVLVNGTANLDFSGPTTVYCYGNCTMSGNVTTNGSLPKNLKIVMVTNGGNPAGSFNVSSGTSLFADVYAPQSIVTLSGSGDIYGYVLGQSVTMTGTSAIHYDLDLNGSAGIVKLVQ